MPSNKQQQKHNGGDRKRDPEESEARARNGDSNDDSHPPVKRQRSTAQFNEGKARSGRKFLTAYNIYFREERRRILDSGVSIEGLYEREVVPTLRSPQKKSGFQALTQVISLRWKNLSASLQAEYQARALEFNTRGEHPNGESPMASQRSSEESTSEVARSYSVPLVAAAAAASLQGGAMVANTTAREGGIPAPLDHVSKGSSSTQTSLEVLTLTQSLVPMLQGLQKCQEITAPYRQDFRAETSVRFGSHHAPASRAPMPREPDPSSPELMGSILQYLVYLLSRPDYHNRAPGTAPSPTSIQGPGIPITGLESMSNGEILQAILSFLRFQPPIGESSSQPLPAQLNNTNDLQSSKSGQGPSMKSAFTNDVMASFGAISSSSTHSSQYHSAGHPSSSNSLSQTLAALSQSIQQQSHDHSASTRNIGILLPSSHPSHASSNTSQSYSFHSQGHSAESNQQYSLQPQLPKQQVAPNEDLLATIEALLNHTRSNDESSERG